MVNMMHIIIIQKQNTSASQGSLKNANFQTSFAKNGFHQKGPLGQKFFHFSLSPAFPHLDEELFGGGLEDILQNLLVNSTEDNATIIDLDERFSSPQVEDENSGVCQEITTEKKDSAKSKAKGRVYCKNIFYDKWPLFFGLKPPLMD